MSLFHRRSIQRMLDECSAFLTQEQLQDFVKKLNGEAEQSLHAQWELALVHALSQEGMVECEPDMGKKPDIKWTNKKTGNSFIADVRTVSDEGLEKENNRWFYRKELSKQIKKRGFNPGHFSDRPNHEMIGEYGDQKVKLKYPPKNESKRLFNKEFHSFLDWIKKEQPDHAEKRLQGEDFDVTLFYHPKRLGDGGGNISYTTYYSQKNNPIHNALEKKSAQLKKSNYQGIKGIILADGGCQQLTSRFRDPTNRTYNDHQVIQKFLSDTTSISFVMTIFARRESENFLTPFGPLKIQSKLFHNNNAKFPVTKECEQALERSLQYIPQPKLDGWNAANHLRNGWDGPHKTWHTSTQLKGDPFMPEISFSSRSLLDLMAGRITNEEFCKMHNFKSVGGNFFERMLKTGFTISNTSIQKLEDEDDDKIIFVFEPDFAAKAFEAPKSKVDIK